MRNKGRSKLLAALVFVSIVMPCFYWLPYVPINIQEAWGEEGLSFDSVSKHKKRLTREMLDKSLALGKKFLLNNQKSDGNFNYLYDFATKELAKDDYQVRQAGALWGLALIHHDTPSEETAKAIAKGLEFFDRNSKETEDRRKYTVYPGAKSGKTGTVALIVLTLVDFLRSEDNPELHEKYTKDLDKYIKFLLSVRKSNGQFHGSYRLEDGNGVGPPSPYSDGESLLALIKAAKYAGQSKLKKGIFESAEEMYRRNIQQALREEPDSRITKGFYQWGSMAYFELYMTNWEGAEKYAQRVIDLAYWMIDTHKTLRRRKNTAYAHEGLIVAWELARITKNNRAVKKIGYVIDRGLFKLSSWQVGGPVQNRFLQKHGTKDPGAVGGVMNGRADPGLRIDVTQHQMHAVILARRYIYKSLTKSTERSKPLTHLSGNREIWFEDIQDAISVSHSEEEALLQFVSNSILFGEKTETGIPPTLKEDNLLRIIFLSVSNGKNPAYIVMGAGRGITKALEQAISKVQRVIKKDFQPKWFKLDIVKDVFFIKIDFDRPLRLERGI